MIEKKKVRTELEVDRISNLPAHLIQLILASLPIREAGKTSVLSRQWRYHWRNITRLVFDDEFDELEDCDSESEVNKLVKRVHEALQVHDGPITEFVLSIPGLTAAADTHHLISYLSNKGISALSLLFDLDPHSFGEEISPSLFRALQLNSLKLQACELKVPPWFVGFTRLTVLQLEQVCLPNDFFQGFLLNCPLLEDLRTSFVVGPRKLEVVGPPRLKVCIFRVYCVETISFRCTPMLSMISIQAEMYDSNTTDIPTVDCLLELEVLLCLIRSSPNLYKLTIQVGPWIPLCILFF
ncbi:unnamed protein product [Linum tenue]|uniref:F-box domain-containing protein n=1 Tax=Linum tenue TaxID=586396 RepID=A0AAV0NJM7_9ROSI|nr:unnamed protein product [Linum tenue]